jgi:hypothetical protein
MSRATIQFTQLEHLLKEVSPGEMLRVHVLEQSKTTSSHGLTHKEISIGLCVRTITAAGDLLAWYCQLERFGFYVPQIADSRSPEQQRYEAAWEQAKAMQTALITLLQGPGRAVTPYGIIEMPVQSLVRGTTGLVAMPSTPVGEA